MIRKKLDLVNNNKIEINYLIAEGDLLFTDFAFTNQAFFL